VRTTEELLGRNSSGSVKKTETNDREDPLRWPRDTLYPQKLALTSPTSGRRSVDIVRSRTKAKECVCFTEYWKFYWSHLLRFFVYMLFRSIEISFICLSHSHLWVSFICEV
jgi:hypothetical protein